MELLIGKEKEFYDFLDSINKEDNVAILTHTDLDGIAAGVILQKILESKKIPVKLIEFLDYKNDILTKISPKLKENKISKIFISDVSIDSFALDDFEKLKKEIDTFLIDHHPISPALKNKKNIIKTKSEDCATFTLYNLGKDLFDSESWKDLVCATMVSEFSYNNESNLKFIQNIYPSSKKETILESIPGKMDLIITYALIYHSDDLKQVYDLVLKKDFKSLEKYYSIIDSEIKKEMENFDKTNEYFKEKKIRIYNFKPKHHIKSIVSTYLSVREPDHTFILITEEKDDKNMFNVSARNQSQKENMNLLLKKGIQGLENANAGGHIPAAGARFQKKDLEQFKENLLR